MSLELYNEVQIMTKLEHPNLIRLYETYEHKGTLHMVMELCSGGDLYSHSVYTEDKARGVVTKICRAIAYCHGQNIAHRVRSTGSLRAYALLLTSLHTLLAHVSPPCANPSDVKNPLFSPVDF
jgi:hypothetical protein